MIADCTPVGAICVAPPYAAVAEADVALRPPGTPPPGPRINHAEAERLGVTIEDFSSDFAVSVRATRRNSKCIENACVLVESINLGPADAAVRWGIYSADKKYAPAFKSLKITATSTASRDAAINAVSLQTDSPVIAIPLAVILKQLGR